MTNGNGTIRVTCNPAAWRDRRRVYRVLVDGREAGAVRADQEFVVSVPPGTHSVKLKIDWTGSREVVVNVAAGSTTGLICEPAGSPWTALTDLILRRPYISLRPE